MSTERTSPMSGSMGLVATSELLKALSAPLRLAVVAELVAGPRCVHELVDALSDAGMPVRQPLLSQHLRILRAAGAVATERRGQEVAYRLAHDGIARLFAEATTQAQRS